MIGSRLLAGLALAAALAAPGVAHGDMIISPGTRPGPKPRPVPATQTPTASPSASTPATPAPDSTIPSGELVVAGGAVVVIAGAGLAAFVALRRRRSGSSDA